MAQHLVAVGSRGVGMYPRIYTHNVRPTLRLVPGRIHLFEEKLMSFGIYLVGYVILIIGLALGANMAHVPVEWIGIGVLCLIGVAVIHGVTATRQKDSSA